MPSSVSPTPTCIVLPKRPRRYSPKSKTGCTTCKIRRVKCGEEKPSCIRCTSTGRKCDGYPPSPASTDDEHSAALAVRRMSSPLDSVPSVHFPGDNVQYLEFYHHCARPSISDKFDRDFWSGTSLQMAQSEPCVRHAIIALGYLNKIETGSLKEARSRLVTAASEQKPLLFHYNKAVNSLVKRISEPSYSPEIGLVACLLFVCIEFLRGNFDTAFAHLNSGLGIVHAYRERQRSTNVKSLPNMIEGLLVPMFSRTMGTAIMWGLPSELALYTSDNPLYIPDRPFTSILEAQLAIHDMRTVAMMSSRSIGPKLMFPGTDLEPDRRHLKAILDSHDAWLRALEGLERTTVLSNEDEITAHSLKVSYYCIYIFVSCGPHLNQSAFDAHLDNFKALVDHAGTVLDATGITSSGSGSPAANFTFELSVIMPLYFAATRCRCPTTRREALALLKRNPPREGLWDAQQHAIVAERVIELEERDVDPVTGWPVEPARIWSTQIRADVDEYGRFSVFFAVGLWGEGRGIPPLPPPGLVLAGHPEGRVWREWFMLS